MFTPIKLNFPKPGFGNSKVNMVYFNDMHGSLSNLDSFISARDEFYRNNENEGTNWTVSAGDIFIKGSPNNDVIAKFVNKYVDVSAIGNHELNNTKEFSKLIDKFNLENKFLGVNINVAKDAPVPIEQQIKSCVYIKDGNEKIGFIGVAPMDLDEHLAKNANNDFVSVMDTRATVEAIRTEVEKLENEGINKIVLLAHTGEFSSSGQDLYKLFARIGGIDVIIGGHDHIHTDRWERSSRYKNDESGEYEPVKIVATGHRKKHYFGGNLDTFGTLNLEFDDNGVLIPEKSVNHNYDTWLFPPTNFVAKNINPKNQRVVGYLDAPIINRTNPYKNENVVANIVADADFWYVKAHAKENEEPDFSFVNPGTVRDSFKNREITLRDIQQVLPFSENLLTIRMTKKQIYAFLSACAKYKQGNADSPGIIQVSHMSYKINPDCSVTNVKILDDEGNVRYDLDCMPDNSKFTCATDDFLINVNKFKKYFNSPIIDKFDVSRAEAFKTYINYCERLVDYSSARITT